MSDQNVDLNDENIDDIIELDIDDDEIVYQINSFGVDFLVDGLVSRLAKQDIYVPHFQRNFVWTVPQASRFIESILLGLPIPGIFLYREDDTQKHLIIDGLQRLTTIESFHKGRLPNNNRVFRLLGVQSRFEGKSLDELDASDQRRFQDAAIHATIIQQSNPKDDRSSIYHIFERLNSGGTPLQPQEMRAAIYHGKFQELIRELNENEYWRSIFGAVNKRSKDQELILRFLSFNYNLSNYNSPMKTFLNKFMGQNQNLDEPIREEFKQCFINTFSRIYLSIGKKAFRPARVINAAVLDSVSVAVASNPQLSSEQILIGYNNLMVNDDYITLVSSSTSDETNVRNRFSLAKQYFDNAGRN